MCVKTPTTKHKRWRTTLTTQTLDSLTESTENVFKASTSITKQKKNLSNDSASRNPRSLFRLASGSLGFYKNITHMQSYIQPNDSIIIDRFYIGLIAARFVTKVTKGIKFDALPARFVTAARFVTTW